LNVIAKFETSPAFFEAKYKAEADPWNFSHSAYELGRYDSIINAISHRRFQRGFEPGCSIGVLTERLADHCDSVEAIDVSNTAITQAQKRCAHLRNVVIRCAGLPEGVPDGKFDLLVVSEIGYYFMTPVWQYIFSALVDSLPLNATVLAAHWLGHSPDHCISGEKVHEIVLAEPRLRLEHSERNENMRLDRLVRL
jgi:trans-aconitate methyltransferase